MRYITNTTTVTSYAMTGETTHNSDTIFVENEFEDERVELTKEEVLNILEEVPDQWFNE